MKKLLFSMLLLAIGFSAMAQQSIQLRSASKAECVKSDMTGLKASFAFSSLDAQQIQTTRGELTELHIEGTFPNGNVGEPQLPMFTRLIAVPTGATPVVTVGAHSETDYTLSDYGMGTVAAMQAPVRKNIDPSTVEYAFSETAYARNSYNDDPIAKVEVLGTMRGITLGRLIVQPVRYNPAAGTVKVFNDIEVSVDFQNGDAASTARMFKNTSSPAFNSVYNQIFNFDMLTGGTRDAYTDHPDLYNTPVKMLVICYSGFQGNAALNNWLQWKLQKGYYVDIYYTGSGSNNAGTTSSAIASFIKTKYNASVTAGNAYTYLIVIGDTDQVPYYSREYIDSTAGYVASDLGYASVDFSTNSNDVFPDMYYSRMSVENTTHLTNYINKVLTYEKYEFTDGGNYLNNVILVGGWDDDWTSIVARPTINYATTYYFNSSNTTYGGFSGGTIKATISTSSTQGYSGNNNGCYQGINNGACFVNYTAHGNKQEWSQPLFTAAQVATLTNTGKYFFAVGNCCLSGNYNNTSTSYSPGSAIGENACFGETMIRVPNAGAIAYIGCSDYTIWMEDYYWAVGSGIHFNSNYDLQGTATTSNTTTGVYDAMFRDDYWNSASSLLFVGNIAVTAAENNNTGHDIDEGYKYYFKYYHTFGDGSVMPYVTKPETNTVTLPSTITPGAGSATINALAGSYVAVTDNNSVIYGVGVANTSGVATVNFTNAIPNSGTLHVVVTRQQYQPYFGTIQVVGSGTQYTITANVNPTTGGTVEGAGQYYENTNCTLTAVPNHGFAFQRWNDNNTDNPRTITVTGNATYTAIFRALEEHHINYTAQQTNGTISVSPTDAIMGDIVTLTATPEAGFALDQWNVNTVSKGNVPVENNQFVMPDSEVTVSATFRVADPLTVADGSGSNSEVPFYALYSDDNYQHTQTIYPSSMLTEMQGMQITKLTYYTNSTTSKTFSSTYEVRFATTTSTSFSSGTVNYISVTSSPVYSGSLTNQSSSIVEISLTTPYTYTGGNLVVDVRSTALGSGYQSMNFIGESGSTYYSVKNRSTSSVPTSGTAVSFMPKITFTYEVPQPYISLSPTSATIITGNTQSLTASYGNVTNPTITYTSSNTSVARVTGNGTSATVTGIAPGTATITATMNGSYTATCAITVEDPSYCTPNPSSVDGKGITSLTFGSGDYVVNNSNSNGLPSSSPYYADYTSMVGAAEAGQQVTVNITYSTGSGTVYSYGTIIWVDWDKDYEFEDSEIVKTGTSAQGSNGTPQQLALTFTVPANQAKGDYRMRIAGADSYFDNYIGGTASANHSPCFTSTYAVCHDYTLRVAGGAYTITCNATTNGTLSVDKTSADEGETVTVTATPDTDYILTALTYTPEGGTAQNINIASMPYTFSMPAANVTVNATFSLPACPKPTNLTVSNLAPSHATVSWDSEAGNYTVRYSKAIVTGTTLDPVFEDGFENGLGNWTTYANDYVSPGNDNTYNITDWHQQSDEDAHGGSYVAMSRSYDGEDQSVDNWLVSPQMTLGDVVKFWVMDDGTYHEYYEVYVSTGSGIVPSNTATSSNTGDFIKVGAPGSTGSWSEKTVDISAYSGQTGYVAIRHHDAEKDWILFDDFGVYNTINTYSYGNWTTVSPNPTTNSCQFTGLSYETLYEVQVQANCGGTDGSSAWSSIMFTTPDNCGAPQELATSNITATTATLSWADDKDSYNLKYRKVYFYEDFEGGTLPTGWTTIDANNDGLTWGIGHATSHSGDNGAYNVSYVYSSDGSVNTTPNDYLVSPQLDLQGTLRVWLSGYARSSSYYSEHFEILLSTTGTSVSDFTTTLVGETTTTNGYVEYTANLSSYAGQKGYIAIRHFNCTDQYYLYVDDFGLYGNENWVTLNPNPTTETANLTGLTPKTEYEWQVQGINCDGNGGNTDWSAVATFTTLPQYIKHINAYSGDGGYYLIASPIGTVSPANVTNMISNTYDLYYFDQAEQDGLEWVNYKSGENQINANFGNLTAGKGFLYANSQNVDLVFTGAAYTGSGQVTLSKTEGAEFEGMNLVGNPFADTAYINNNHSFYRMASGGAAIEPTLVTGAIAPMEGVFVEAASDGETITFSTTAPSKVANLALNLTKGNSFVDRAIVCFNETRQLSKFQLKKNSTKVYIPQEGKDYAVVRSETMGVMPVNFKAENNGTYTLSFTSEEVSFAYLHLIDNMTGNDVDLLANPSYSFNAKTTDYESRFKLVFATGNSTDDTFAFFSNGSFVINNEGEATLQVIDVNGRILKSESINGCANVNVNAAQGIYMLRLVNGDNVKVQKVVVK